jgi:ABC-type antimicrobial peptide transport system ATPase subunit
MNIKGTIKKIHPTETVGASGFQKRKVWVEVDSDSKYPQTIEIEFQGDKTSLADNLSAGQVVDLSINLKGREWTNDKQETKVFNTIVAWKVQVEGGQSQPNTFNNSVVMNADMGADVSGGGEDDESDLPF